MEVGSDYLFTNLRISPDPLIRLRQAARLRVSIEVSRETLPIERPSPREAGRRCRRRMRGPYVFTNRRISTFNISPTAMKNIIVDDPP